LAFVLAWVTVLVQLFVKVRGLQVMDQGKQRTRPGSKIPTCYLKRKEKWREKESEKGVKICSSNKSARKPRRASK
jgi:hypothetical protein